MHENHFKIIGNSRDDNSYPQFLYKDVKNPIKDKITQINKTLGEIIQESRSNDKSFLAVVVARVECEEDKPEYRLFEASFFLRYVLNSLEKNCFVADPFDDQVLIFDKCFALDLQDQNAVEFKPFLNTYIIDSIMKKQSSFIRILQDVINPKIKLENEKVIKFRLFLEKEYPEEQEIIKIFKKNYSK